MNKISQILCAVSQTKKIKGNLNSDLANQIIIEFVTYSNITIGDNGFYATQINKKDKYICIGAFLTNWSSSSSALATSQLNVFANANNIYIKSAIGATFSKVEVNIVYKKIN